MRRVEAVGLLVWLAACGGGSPKARDGAPHADAGAKAATDASVMTLDAGHTSSPGTTSDGSTGPSTHDAGSSALPCNGHGELCSRRYDEVVFPATHNAHAAKEYGYTIANTNQLSGIAKQLEDGIRCLLMDVYDDGGEHVFCHGPCQLGKTPHTDGLTLVKQFLDAHPREVVTFIYEDHLAADQIAADFASTGLDAYVYTHGAGEAWPTLGEMIDANTRLVVTAENGSPPPAWFHHVWDVAWDTPYEYRSAADFVCDLNRGSRDNDLFLINHWVSSGVGSIYLPSEDGAKTVNAYDVLYARAKKCADETGDVPNFIAVDFYEHGDLFQAVDALNGF